MKTSYQSRALKTWKALAPYVKGCRTVYQYRKAVTKFNEEKHRSVKIANGATRVCFICSDYVIKKDYGDNLDDFGGCADELRKYEYAQYEGFDYLFAPIERLTNNVYVMPRVRIDRPWSSVNIDKFFGNLTYEENYFINDNVGDIHRGNIGIYHGKIVLIDYACN